MYTVEHFGSKGWEISKENVQKCEALRELDDIIAEGFSARLTYSNSKESQYHKDNCERIGVCTCP
jgi:hypothetical protein